MSLIHVPGGLVTASENPDQARTVTGTAVHYGTIGRTSAGPVVFAPGSLTRSLTARASKVRLCLEHDRARVVGRLTDYDDGPTALLASFRIAGTPAGDLALVEAAEGVRDGLSVGVDVIHATRDRDGALVVTEAALHEVSLVAFPAYDDARLTDVAASDPGHHDPRAIALRLRLTL
jgi:HK97 family phage prohead protease